MKRFIAISVSSLILTTALFFAARGMVGFLSFSETQDGFEPPTTAIEDFVPEFIDPYANWSRPEGPIRVALQAGHWQAQNAPDEQENLRLNTGASAAGFTEWETNLRIAREIQPLLEAHGIAVDILPTTIPPEYYADAFIAIHADGSLDTSATGYKIAGPWRDRSGQSQTLVSMLEAAYASSTKLPQDPNITRNMRGYYAFNWRKYEHSIHPMTPAAIVEAGFITNARDRALITRSPHIAAQGIANGVLEFLAPLQEELATHVTSSLETL